MRIAPYLPARRASPAGTFPHVVGDKRTALLQGRELAGDYPRWLVWRRFLNFAFT